MPLRYPASKSMRGKSDWIRGFLINVLDSGKQAVKIQQDLQEAKNLGITGTPAFFLGLTTPGKTIKGTNIEGAQPIEVYPPSESIACSIRRMNL